MFSPKMSNFLQKPTKKCIFGLILKNPRKTQGPFENPRKTQGPQKNPRTQDCFEKPKILGENPSSGNAANYIIIIFYSYILIFLYDCLRLVIKIHTLHKNNENDNWSMTPCLY